MVPQFPQVGVFAADALFFTGQYWSDVLWTYVYEKFDQSGQSICSKTVYLSF